MPTFIFPGENTPEQKAKNDKTIKRTLDGLDYMSGVLEEERKGLLQLKQDYEKAQSEFFKGLMKQVENLPAKERQKVVEELTKKWDYDNPIPSKLKMMKEKIDDIFKEVKDFKSEGPFKPWAVYPVLPYDEQKKYLLSLGFPEEGFLSKEEFELEQYKQLINKRKKETSNE